MCEFACCFLCLLQAKCDVAFLFPPPMSCGRKRENWGMRYGYELELSWKDALCRRGWAEQPQSSSWFFEHHIGTCSLGLGGPEVGSVQQHPCVPSPVSSLPCRTLYSAWLFSLSVCNAFIVLVLWFCYSPQSSLHDSHSLLPKTKCLKLWP